MAALGVESVNLYPEDNAKKHRTIKFELVHDENPSLVIRRGDPFSFAVTFNRGYNCSFDKIRTIFSYDGGEERGCRGGAWVTNNKEHSKDLVEWSVIITDHSDKTLKLEVRPSIVAPAGLYHMSIKTSINSGNKILTHNHPQDIYILFNPWNKEDGVYMPKENLLDEYVLNDVGKVWTINKGTSSGREWVFGQFAAPALQSMVKIIHKTNIKYESKGDPIELSRALTRVLGSILIGKWESPYDDGTHPCMWTGTIPILEQFLEKDQVMYGQCWVFSSLTTTVCRTLGIPCRPVTNMVSAHDSNTSLSIDTLYNNKNEVIQANESVWNFHVWNDVWMARPDLPQGYGGWQAIDATPQEESKGFFQCGPASLEAIKNGEIGLNYDVPFVMAEVNADVLHWKEDEEALCGYKRIFTDCKRIGTALYTKLPFIFDPNGDGDRENIIYLYKDPENTREERLTYFKAIQALKLSSAYYDIPEDLDDDVNFLLKSIDELNIGEPFAVVFEIENISDKPYTVIATLSAASIYYTGITAHQLKKDTREIKMKPKTKQQFRMIIMLEDYLNKLVEFNLIKIRAIATVKETKYTWAGEDDFQIVKPKLNVQTAGKFVELGLSTRISFGFKNPLKNKLTGCKLLFESPGLLKHTRKSIKDIMPEEEVMLEHFVTPQASGQYKIVAIFYSKELHDIMGSAELTVICH